MKFLIQAVEQTSIEISHNNTTTTKKTWPWALIYVGISQDDIQSATEKIKKFIKKIQSVRLFCWSEWKIDSSLVDNQGEILLVSSFTLYSRNKKGSSVDYTQSAPFKESKRIYQQIIDELTKTNIIFQSWTFGAMMKITSINSGPINHVWEL